MRLCEQCHMAQFNGKWHSSNQRNLFSLGVCFNNLKYKSKAISTNSATWHCSKTQVLCGFEPNSAIFPSSALGQLWLALSAPYGGTLACRLGQALNGAHWAPAPPKGGGETRLCANFLRRTYLALPLGPLRPGGTLPSGRSPLPRRSVLDVCHWQTAPEAAAETLAPLGD